MKRTEGIEDLGKLAALIQKERKAKSAPNDVSPGLTDEFAGALQRGADEAISNTPGESGHPEGGIDIEKILVEYHLLRGYVDDRVDSRSLRETALHLLNRLLSRAIGSAVNAYVAEQVLEVQQHRGEYLAFVAHDLKTPLTAISLATRVLEQKLDNPSVSTTQMLKTLQNNVSRLDGLVEKVLEENTHLRSEFGRRLERQAFELWPLVAALLYDLHPVAKTGDITLVNQVPEGLFVHADAGLLRRVFQNFITYAMRYTERGKVIVGARKLDMEGSVECSVSGKSARIPSELLRRIFGESGTEPHENNLTALGMGLSIAKTFVEAHEGKVNIESEKGVGSTFRFTLPVRQDKAIAS